MDFGKILEAATEPTGLVGVTLFFVLLVLANQKRKKNENFVLFVFIFLAVASLFGGLVIAYKDVSANENGSTDTINYNVKYFLKYAIGITIITDTGDYNSGDSDVENNGR